MPNKPTKLSPPESVPTEFSIELERDEQAWIVLRIFHPDKFVLDSLGNFIPIPAPKGCLGLMMIFDTEENAQAHFGGPVDMQSITRHTR